MTTGHNFGASTSHHTQSTSAVANGFTPVQNAVLNLLKTVTTMAGASVTDICKQLKQFSENQVKYVLGETVERDPAETMKFIHSFVLSLSLFSLLFRQALEFLSGEGHIYSTTDDDHFRAASNN